MNAASTPGSPRIWITPVTASTVNHTHMIGPKTNATLPVPRLCRVNRKTRITSAIGIT